MNQEATKSNSHASGDPSNPCPICLGPILQDSYLDKCFRTFLLYLCVCVWLPRKLLKGKENILVFWDFLHSLHVSFQIVKILQRLEFWVSLAIKWSIDFLCYQCYKLKAVLFSFLCSISWVGFLQNLANCDIKKPFWAFSLFFSIILLKFGLHEIWSKIFV